MATKAKPKNPTLKSMFVGRIEDLDVAWFSKIGGFASETEIATAHAGGDSITTFKSPGKTKYNPIEVMLVASENKELYDWRQRVIASADADGVPDDDVKKTFYIDVYSKGSRKLGRWVFEECFPSKDVPGELDASASAFTEETYTFEYTKYHWEKAA